LATTAAANKIKTIEDLCRWQCKGNASNANEQLKELKLEMPQMSAAAAQIVDS
jgi:hypothetical protein